MRKTNEPQNLTNIDRPHPDSLPRLPNISYLTAYICESEADHFINCVRGEYATITEEACRYKAEQEKCSLEEAEAELKHQWEMSSKLLKPYQGLSADELHLWHQIRDQFRKDPNLVGDESHVWFTVNTEGHVYCDAYLLDGHDSRNMDQLARQANVASEAELVFDSLNIHPENYSHEMLEFIKGSGLTDAFNEYLAGRILQHQDEMTIEDPEFSGS